MNLKVKCISALKLKRLSAVQQAERYARQGKHNEAKRCQVYAETAAAELRRRGIPA